MSLIIRLQRVGKKKQPVFRIALAEKHKAADKAVKEVLGHYNPRTKEFGIKSEERLRYWMEQHIPLSATVHNLLVSKGILSGAKMRAWVPKKKLSQSPTETAVQAPAEQAASAPTAEASTTAAATEEAPAEAKQEQASAQTPEASAEETEAEKKEEIPAKKASN